MKSIRNKIQNALVGSVIFVGICAAIVFVVVEMGALRSQRIIETMTMENSIISLSDKLVLTYNNAVKSPGEAAAAAGYRQTRREILEVLTELEKRIVSQESRLLLVGVENTVKKVVDECDTGIQEVQENNFLNISERFVQANTNNDFVRDNTRTLLQKELEYLSLTQANARFVYLLSLVVSAGALVLVVFISIYFARSFATQLVSPIEELTKTAGLVAGGDMDVPINPILLAQQDEVGILSNSFASMVTKIKEKIAEINTEKDKVEENNTALEKLNKFMVDRELKMVQLKKRVAELEKQTTV